VASTGPIKGNQDDRGFIIMGKKILVVDDSSIMRKMIKETLQSGDHEIIGEAKNGEDAISMYKDLQPELVTMDITMRGMDGLTAAKEIMEIDANAQIIFLSNLDGEKYSDEAKRLGAKGFINKHQSRDILTIIDAL
jgi:two-component system chemotaxis response regulator CheY